MKYCIGTVKYGVLKVFKYKIGVKDGGCRMKRYNIQRFIDAHHKSPMMQEIMTLREKYDLYMKAERYVSEEVPDKDDAFIRK